MTEASLPPATRMAYEVPKPKNWEDFQRACVVLYQAELNDPHAQEYGRQGQSQRGIDILGRRNGDPDHFVGIQCRRVEKPLSRKKIEEDCRAALELEAELKEIIFATTAPDDTGATDASLAVEKILRAEGHDITVALYGWGQLQLRIALHPTALRVFNPALHLSSSMGFHLFQAPSLPMHYVDRPEVLHSLVAALCGDNAFPGILRKVSMFGGGGIGKTTLAAALAHHPDVRALFPDGVLWTELGQEPQIEPKLKAWVDAVAGPGAGALSLEASIGLLRTALHQKAVLIVVDNVWETEHLLPFILGGGRCGLVFTTRRATIADDVGAVELRVGELAPEQARALLLQRVPNRDWDGEALARLDALAMSVGYIALAVTLIGGLLNRRISIAEVERRLASQAEAPRPGSAREALQTCLLASLSYIRVQDPTAWERFIWLAATPPGALLNSECCGALWSTTADDAEQTLWQLADDALLVRLGECYRVHDLLHELAHRFAILPAPEGLGFQIDHLHAEIVRRYQLRAPGGRWDLVPPDGYVHLHLFWHVVRAGSASVARDILLARRDDHVLAWFAACDSVGQRSAYEADARAALRLFARETDGGSSGQILCALIISSLRSSLVNVKPDIIEALVAHGTWSTLSSFFGITQSLSTLDMHGVDLLIAFIRGVDRRQDEDFAATQLSARLRAQALAICKDSLRPPGASPTELLKWAKLVPLLPTDEAEAVIRTIMEAGDQVGDQVEAFTDFPPQMRAIYRSVVLKSIERRPALDDRIRLLSRFFQQLPPEDRTSRAEQLEAWLIEYVIALKGYDPRKPLHTESDSDVGIDRSGMSGVDPLPETGNAPPADPIRSAVPVLFESEGTRDAEFIEIDSDDDPSVGCISSSFMADLSNAFYFLPRTTLLTISQLLGSCRFEEGASWHLNQLNHILTLEEKQQTNRHKTDARITRAIATRDFKEAFRAISRLPAAVDAFISTLDDIEIWYWNQERIAAAWLPVWLELDSDERRRSAEALVEKSPEGLGARAMLLAVSSPDEQELDRFSEALDKVRVEDRHAVTLVCVSVGVGPIGEAARSRLLRISDLDDQSAAVVALMPYLPRDYPAEILDAWTEREIGGTRALTLIAVMADLINAIAAGALSDVVESSARRESEWWLVEALTSTLRRVDSAAELMAMSYASRHIQAFDLRARLIGRIARRAADCGHFDLALDTLTGIAEGALAWDEAVELAGHLALLSAFDEARRAAASIPSSEARSRAFAQIAIELYAQGRFEEAEAMLVNDVAAPEWRAFVLQLVGGARFKSEKADHARPIRTGQRKAEPSPSDVAAAIAAASLSVGKLATLSPLNEAAKNHDIAALRQRAGDLWQRPSRGDLLLSELLAQESRPILLRKLAKLAPFVALGPPDDVTQMIRAISVCARCWS